VEMNEADERAMAKRTGFQRGVLRQALRRLVALDQATKVTEDGRAIYRPRRSLS